MDRIQKTCLILITIAILVGVGFYCWSVIKRAEVVCISAGGTWHADENWCSHPGSFEIIPFSEIGK